MCAQKARKEKKIEKWVKYTPVGYCRPTPGHIKSEAEALDVHQPPAGKRRCCATYKSDLLAYPSEFLTEKEAAFWKRK